MIEDQKDGIKNIVKEEHQNKGKNKMISIILDTSFFLKKITVLTFAPKKGFCSWCTKNIFDKSCKRTHIHHYFYLPIMTWACTIEICARCHGIESWRLRKEKNRYE